MFDLTFLSGIRRYIIILVGVIAGVYGFAGTPIDQQEWGGVADAVLNFGIAALALSSKFRPDADA